MALAARYADAPGSSARIQLEKDERRSNGAASTTGYLMLMPVSEYDIRSR